jgi:hypothetical protein
LKIAGKLNPLSWNNKIYSYMRYVGRLMGLTINKLA